MGKLTISRRKSRSPQIGDMRDRVILYQRDIQAPVFGDANFTEQYTSLAEVWASVETIDGPTIFDEVNTKVVATIIFKIRYRSDVTTETVVEHNNNHYKILSPPNQDKRNRFMFLKCTLMGDKDYEANQ